MTSRKHDSCVGILYCGDLGSALGRLLRQAGVRVVTTCEGRSARTKVRAEEAGVEILSTIGDVIAVADAIVSLVLPESAEEVARQCVANADRTTAGSLYIDANSIGLDSLSTIGGLFAGTRFRFVDAAIHGGAARLHEMGVLYLSGVHAEEAESLFQGVVRVLRLGDEPGQATRMKLLMAGQSKCMTMLFLQIGALACRAGMWDAFLAESRTFYPAIMTAVERMLVTYPEHAKRRVGELASMESLAHEVGAPCQVIQAAREWLENVAAHWEHRDESTQLCDTSAIVQSAAGIAPLEREKSHVLG